MKTKDTVLKMFCRTERHKRAESGEIPYHLFFGMSLAVVLLFAGIGIVGATADYYVATWGCDDNKGTSVDEPWQHPSYAAQQAQAGDTIYLMEGIWYDEHVIFANSGNATHPITLTAYNGTPILDGVTDAGIAIRLQPYPGGELREYINIDNLRIINYERAILAKDISRYINISNCDFTTKLSSIRISELATHDICVKDSTVSVTGGTGIMTTYSASNVSYINCTALEAGHNGLSINHAYDSIIVNGTASNTDHNGIQIAGATNCVAKNGLAFDTGDNGYYMANGDFNILVEDCKAHNTNSRGIVVDIAEDITIRRWQSWNIFSADIHVMCAEPMRGISVTKNVYIIDSEIIEDNPASSSIRIGGNAANIWAVNTIWGGTAEIYDTDADFTAGYYLDVLVQDENGNPVSGATVTVSHPNVTIHDLDGEGGDIEIEVNAINLHTTPLFPSYTDGLLQPQKISQTVTGSDGHTPLPANADNTVVVADYRFDRHGSPWYQHNLQTTEFNDWILTAEKEGVSATVTGIDPSKNWYREDPNSYPIEGKGTVIITLPTTVETPTTYTTITPQPDETGWNNVTPVVVTAFRSDSSGSGISYTNYSKTSETGPWTTVDTATATGPDAENVAAISESGFNVTVSDEDTTQIWYYSVDSDSNVEHVKDVTVKIDTTATGIISGIVTNTTGATVQGATVAVEGTLKSGETDANGIYTLTDVPINTYTVTCTAPDYQDSYQSNIAVTEGETTQVIFALISSTITPLGDLAGEWRFEEGAGESAVDSSGNENNGTIHGSANMAVGKIGSALEFDGRDDYVSIPNSPTLNPAEEITLLAWVNPGVIPQAGWNKIIAKPYTNSSYPWQQYALALNNNQFVFELNTEGTKDAIASTETLEPNTWYHVTGTYDGSEMRIYVNAALNGTMPKSGAIAAYPTDVHIGAGIYSDAETEYINGTVDEVKIYNRALSADEIQADYEEGLAYMKGDFNNNGESADAGDLAMMEDAKENVFTPDATYDLDGDGNPADEDDLTLLKNASVGKAVLE